MPKLQQSGNRRVITAILGSLFQSAMLQGDCFFDSWAETTSHDMVRNLTSTTTTTTTTTTTKKRISFQEPEWSTVRYSIEEHGKTKYHLIWGHYTWNPFKSMNISIKNKSLLSMVLFLPWMHKFYPIFFSDLYRLIGFLPLANPSIQDARVFLRSQWSTCPDAPRDLGRTPFQQPPLDNLHSKQWGANRKRQGWKKSKRTMTVSL